MSRCRVSVIGNLGADPEQRYTQKGALITEFRIAVNQVQNGPDGERKESTEWFRIRVGGSRAEYCGKFLKGNRVLVDGRMTIEHFQRRDGTDGTGFTVWADDVQNLTPRGDQAGGDDEGYAPQPQQQQRQPAAAGQRGAQVEPPDLEDLPF